nr:hydrogen gas-evolving membrane-bound hydrogenase subunit E [Halorhodospira halophila]
MAWQIVATRMLFRSVVLFIVFGLLMAVTWARLAAPDLALAEAAIGAGITGALLLSAYRALLPPDSRDDGSDSPPPPVPPWAAVTVAVLAGALIAGIGWAVVGLEPPEQTAGRLALARLEESGVDNPVTAVLLNFRSIDTLAEVVVLFVAFLAARVVAQDLVHAGPGDWLRASYREPLLVQPLIAFVGPMTVLAAGYLLWAGADQPGGAFQAGAVLAALGVLLRLTGRLRPTEETSFAERLALVGGLVLFTAIGLAGAGVASAVLDYPEAWTYELILIIETALMLAIALPLVLLFSGSGGLRGEVR